jgi:serine/threonine protein kinase
MSSGLPDFADHGYHATRLLGRNVAAGRSTWLATRLSDGVEVVIKRFSFAASDASWESLRDHEREIDVLRELDHPGIPRFLDGFQTGDGFGLVQSFVAGRPLAARGSFALPELLDVARKILKILVYLQERMPPVIHRDLKPDNILHDGRGRVWLVDFGLARAQHDTTSTLAVGTPGFMPPEQVLGRALGPPADLYGLGATLIACLTGRRGAELGDLIDATFRFDLDRLPALPGAIRGWLARLVEPAAADRFPSAAAALAALGAAERGEDRPAPTSDDGETPKAPRRSSPLFFAVFGVVALAGIGAMSFIGALNRLAPAPPPEREDLVELLSEQHDLRPGAFIRQADPLEASPPRELPLRCDSPLAISARSFTLPKGEPQLSAAAGCDLTLTDVRVEADGPVLELQEGARVRLIRSELRNSGGAPLVALDGEESRLEADATTFEAAQGCALDVSQGQVTLRGGRVATLGPNAMRVSRGGLVIVDGATVQGEVATHRGHVLGLDQARDAETRKALREEHFKTGACHGIQTCLIEHGYFGTLALQVIGRLKGGAIDRVVLVDASGGTLEPPLRACLEASGAASPPPSTPPRGGGQLAADLPLAYRGCGLTGQMNGGTRMLNVSSFFFVADERPDEAKRLARLFR